MRLWHRKQQETKSKSVDFGVHIRCLYDIQLWVSLSIIPSHIFKDAQKHLVDMYFSACQYNQSESNLAFFPWNALGKCPRKFPRKEKAKKQLRKAVKKIGLTFHLSKSEQNEHWLKKLSDVGWPGFLKGGWILELGNFFGIFVLPKGQGYMETNKSAKLKSPGFSFPVFLFRKQRFHPNISKKDIPWLDAPHWFTGGAHRFLDFGESSWDGFGGRFLGRF